MKRAPASAIVLAALAMGVAGAVLMSAGDRNRDAEDAPAEAARVAAAHAGTSPGTAPPGTAPGAFAQATNSAPQQESGVIAVRIDQASGHATLRVNEQWLDRHGRAMLAQVRVACRYAPARQQWQRLPASPTRIAYRVEPRDKTATSEGERLFYELPREAGLYWVYWIEEPADGGEKRVVSERRETFTAGRARCDGANAAVVEAGKVEACVPRADGAGRQMVADPEVACAELR